MFDRIFKNAPSAIDEKIADLYSDLAGYEAHTDDYSNVIDQIVKLTKLKKEAGSPSWAPSPDAVVGAVASIGGVLLILNYEKLDNVTSKALGFVRKAVN
jgi:hypothetical protein